MPAHAQTAPPPTNLQAVAGWRQITLSWTASASPDVTHYSVHRATQSGGPYTQVASPVNGTSFTDTGLTTGTIYFYVVRASAPAGESLNSVEMSAEPRYEVTKPSVAITAPASNATLTALTAITGTASDTGSGASGVERVDVLLYRTWRGVTEYWDGATQGWQGSATPLPTSSEIGWTRSSLPGGANLPPGQYQIQAQSFDKAGNASTVVARSFKMAGDTTAPVTVITTPANNSYILALPEIKGTIQDEANGSGVDYVKVRLYRTWGGVTEYWSGSSWGAANIFLNATLTGQVNGVYSWTLAGVWPTGASLPDGAYSISAIGYDCSGNNASALSTTTKVGDDTTPPSATLSVPVSGAKLTNSGLTQLSGTASDPVVDGQNRSGMNLVRLFIERTVNGVLQNWNPSTGQWTTASSFWTLNYTTRNDGPWSVTSQLPTGANLPPGTYTIRVAAFDVTNNSRSYSWTIQIVGPPTNLTATAGAGKVDLSWNASAGALSYTLYRSTDAGQVGSALATNLTSTTYRDTNVMANTTYYYRVSALADNGETDKSNQAPATPTAAPQADLRLRTDEEGDFGGDNVYSASGSAQSRSLLTTSSVPGIYLVQVQNDGDQAFSFVVQGSSGGDGWSVRYYQLTNSTGEDPALDPDASAQEITESVTGQGWSTPELAAGATCLLRVEVTAENSVADGASKAVTVRVSSHAALATADAVVLTTTRKRQLLGMQYKREKDATWQPVTSEPVEVVAGEVVGFKALMASGPEPVTAPDKFKLKWTHGSELHIGEIVWLEFPAPEEGQTNNLSRVSVEWGDEVHADVRVLAETNE